MSLSGAEKFELVALELHERHQTLTHKADQDRLEELREKKAKSSAPKTPAKKTTGTTPAKKTTPRKK